MGNFKCLGLIITSVGDSNEEIKSRMGQSKTATMQLNNYRLHKLQSIIRLGLSNHSREHKLIQAELLDVNKNSISRFSYVVSLLETKVKEGMGMDTT